MRAERKKKLEEKLTKAKTMLIRDEKRIKKINKSQLSEQAQLWRAISSVNVYKVILLQVKVYVLIFEISIKKGGNSIFGKNDFTFKKVDKTTFNMFKALISRFLMYICLFMNI
jgi:hypothetical protein